MNQKTICIPVKGGGWIRLEFDNKNMLDTFKWIDTTGLFIIPVGNTERFEYIFNSLSIVFGDRLVVEDQITAPSSAGESEE